MDVVGVNTIEDGALSNSGSVAIGNGDQLTLSGDVVTDASGGSIAVAATGSLTLEGNASLTVDFVSGGNSVMTADGGVIVIEDDTLGAGSGDAFVAGSSVTATGGTLTVDDVAFTAGASVTLSSGSVTLEGSAIDGSGALSGNLTGDITSVEASGGNLDITGLTLGTVAATVDNGDVLTVGAPNETVTFSTAANAGTIEVAAGTLQVTGAITGTGTTQIDAGATFEIGSTDAETVTFNGGGSAGGTFVIDNAALADANHYTGTIGDGSAGDFISGDTIDLKDVSYTPATETDVWSQGVGLNSGSGTLTIYDGTTAEASIKLAGSFTQNDFELQGDTGGGTSGGTEVVWNPSATTNSFAAGSTISFENGHWVVDDGIVTLSGVDQVTIGTQTYLLVDHTGATGGYQSIQTAVGAASAGDTVLVAPGTYTEQVTVGSGLDGLTITAVNGAGTVTVDAPTTLQETALSPTSGNPIDGIFTVDGVSNVTISNIAVDGLGYGDGAHFAPNQPGTGSEGPSLIGIAYVDATGGAISGDTITNTDENDGGFGAQRNFGIFVVNNTTLAGDVPTAGEASTLNTITISDSTLSGFQKGGIVVEYADATISGNTLTGAGDVSTAQNAIEDRELTGTVSNNIITAIGYDGSGPPPPPRACSASTITASTSSAIRSPARSARATTAAGVAGRVSCAGFRPTARSRTTSAANVDNGVVVLSDAFGDDILGVWTVSGNTTTNVVPVADGGDSIYFDPDPTTSARPPLSPAAAPAISATCSSSRPAPTRSPAAAAAAIASWWSTALISAPPTPSTATAAASTSSSTLPAPPRATRSQSAAMSPTFRRSTLSARPTPRPTPRRSTSTSPRRRAC